MWDTQTAEFYSTLRETGTLKFAREKMDLESDYII